MKQKYIKPQAKDLGDTSVASGSCASGHDERAVGDCLDDGMQALAPCTVGSNVYPRVLFLPSGAFAGYSCVNGAVAG
jgi:hypothetical protein